MTAQDKEIAQLHDNIVEDVKDIFEKYMSIIGLDVPENNEETAKSKLLYIMKDAITQIEEEESID